MGYCGGTVKQAPHFNTMKLILTSSRGTSNPKLESSLRSFLDSLVPLMRIEEARVRLEYVHEASPPYRATAHLVVPGPDLKADVCDHTEFTALSKLTDRLRSQVLERVGKRLKRFSGRGRLPQYLHP